MSDIARISDAVQTSLDMARDLGKDRLGLIGYGHIELWHEDGSLGLVRPFTNLITDAGDLWHANKVISGILPANSTAFLLSGMQIGSGTAAVVKTGAAMGTLLAGQAFDPAHPYVNNLGAGLGVEAIYKTTFGAGVGTGTVNEATLTYGTVTSASSSGNTVARILTGAIVKAAGDSLAVIWKTRFLGA